MRSGAGWHGLVYRAKRGPVKWPLERRPSSVRRSTFHEAVTGPCGGSELNVNAMRSPFRTLIVIMVAAAVAALPLAGGFAEVPSATSDAASRMVEHGDCCDHGNPCEKKNTDGCGSTAGCMVKCSAMSAAVLATSIVRATHNGETESLLVQRLASTADNPPSPPPRA